MDHGDQLAGLRILIVEDEFLLAMELEMLLQRHGCLVVGPVSSVGRALALLETEPPDVAVLDVNLKGERATPIAAALQAREVPFVLLTGYSGPQLSEPELRVAPRVDKPVSCRALCRAMAQAMEPATPS